MSRYDIEPLVRRLGGIDRASETLEVPELRLRSYLRRGLSLERAESLAEAAGFHPREVWPELGDEVVESVDSDSWKRDVPSDWVKARQACRLVHISYRQLDYWHRECGLHVEHAPTGSGQRRYLSPDDVQRLDVVARLVRAGVLGGGVESVVELVDEQWSDPAPEIVTITLQGGIDIVLPVRTVAELNAELAA